MPRIPGVPRTILVALEAVGPRLDAERAVEALAEGLESAGRSVDRCPLHRIEELGAVAFDARMRSARALVCGTERLHRGGLADTLVAEVATRARQAGVPCHAVTARNELDAFDARLLDLQTILEARTTAALVRAGRHLAEWI